MNIAMILEWYQLFLKDAKALTDFMLTEIITIGNVTFTPLLLLTGTGLAFYLAIAIPKWLLS